MPLPPTGTLAWSPDGQLLATINDNMPHAVWIWDLRSAELAAVLCHISTVRAMAWSPAGQSLGVVTGGGRLYMWSPAGASVVHVPLGNFQVGSRKISGEVRVVGSRCWWRLLQGNCADSAYANRNRQPFCCLP